MRPPPLNFSDASQDADQRAKLQEIVGIWRAAIAPKLNAEIDDLPNNQSLMITAAALMAGMTVGHMLAVGILSSRDKKRISEMVGRNYRAGIEFGLREAMDAAAAQSGGAAH